MEIETRATSWGIELKYTGDKAVFTEDICSTESAEKLIENHLTACREISNGMGISDLDFAFKVADAFLNDSEREQLIEKLQNN